MAPQRNFNFRSSHLDAADNVWFSRELESIDQRAYEEALPGLLALRYIPLASDVDPASNSYTYRMYGKRGSAQLSGKDADDAPSVDVDGTEVTHRIETLTDSYKWTVFEVQRAAKTRTPLDAMRRAAAKYAIDNKTDRMLAFGRGASSGTYGLLNTPGVDLATVSSKTSGTTFKTNAATDPDKILGDLNEIVSFLFEEQKQAQIEGMPEFLKFTILLPLGAWGAIASTPRSDNSDMTILQYAIKNNPMIEAIEPWHRCNEAGAGSVGRMVAYPRHPVVLGGIIGQDFTELAPQERNFDIVIPCHSSCGGVALRYPVVVAYRDGV